jgi:hypothetical protein
LLLVGYLFGPLHTVLNLGAFADPARMPARVARSASRRAWISSSTSMTSIASPSPAKSLACAFLGRSAPAAGDGWPQVGGFSFAGADRYWPVGISRGHYRYGASLGISPKLLLFGR